MGTTVLCIISGILSHLCFCGARYVGTSGRGTTLFILTGLGSIYS